MTDTSKTTRPTFAANPIEVALTRLVLIMAPSFQGGHSETGGEVAAYLDIPFPLQMNNLATAARKHGFDPDGLWPWWAKMRAERQAISNADARARLRGSAPQP